MKNKVRLIKAKKKDKVKSKNFNITGGAGGDGSTGYEYVDANGNIIPKWASTLIVNPKPKKKVSKKKLVCLVCKIPFIEGKGFIGKHKFPCANSRYGWSFVEEAKPTKKQLLKEKYLEAKRELVQATKDEYKAHMIYLKRKITFDLAEQKYKECKK